MGAQELKAKKKEGKKDTKINSKRDGADKMKIEMFGKAD